MHSEVVTREECLLLFCLPNLTCVPFTGRFNPEFYWKEIQENVILDFPLVMQNFSPVAPKGAGLMLGQRQSVRLSGTFRSAYGRASASHISDLRVSLRLRAHFRRKPYSAFLRDPGKSASVLLLSRQEKKSRPVRNHRRVPGITSIGNSLYGMWPLPTHCVFQMETTSRGRRNRSHRSSSSSAKGNHSPLSPRFPTLEDALSAQRND